MSYLKKTLISPFLQFIIISIYIIFYNKTNIIIVEFINSLVELNYLNKVLNDIINIGNIVILIINIILFILLINIGNSLLNFIFEFFNFKNLFYISLLTYIFYINYTTFNINLEVNLESIFLDIDTIKTLLKLSIIVAIQFFISLFILEQFIRNYFTKNNNYFYIRLLINYINNNIINTNTFQLVYSFIIICLKEIILVGLFLDLIYYFLV